MALTETYVQNSETPTRDIEGFVHVIDPAQGVLHTFNEVGTRVWQLLEKPRTLSEVVAILDQEYEVDRDKLEADVLAFAHELLERGILLRNE